VDNYYLIDLLLNNLKLLQMATCGKLTCLVQYKV